MKQNRKRDRQSRSKHSRNKTILWNKTEKDTKKDRYTRNKGRNKQMLKNKKNKWLETGLRKEERKKDMFKDKNWERK